VSIDLSAYESDALVGEVLPRESKGRAAAEALLEQVTTMVHQYDEESYRKTQAEHFLTLLDEEAGAFTFQTFDDNKPRKLGKLARILHGSLEQHWQELCRLNAAGAGVFVTVNETDLQGREKTNIIRVRAVWQEADRGDEPTLPCQPHICVESSRGKHHQYVLTDTAQLDEFAAVQLRLVDDYGSDPNAKDLARVLRLPGFFHQKDPTNPQMVTIVHESGEQPMAWDKLKQIFPPVAASRNNKPKTSPVPIENTDEVESALAVLNPDDGYGTWLNVGMALHSKGGGDAALQLWDDWSAKGNSYREGECAYKWSTFSDDGGITLKTLFSYANGTGWRYHEAPENDDWPEPIPLDSFELPKWPEGVFPAPLGGFVQSVSDSLEVPVEVSFIDTLAVCSTAICGKYQLEVKDGYVEPLNIWGMPIQPPATRKTGVKQAVMFPIVEYEDECYLALESDIKANRSERKTLEKRIDAKRNQAAKAKTTEDYRKLCREVTELEESMPDEIKAPRLWTEDITPENLGTLMAENNQRMAVLSAEGGIFGIMAGRYSKGAPNLDIFLKGHAGEPVRVDRGSREPVRMDRPLLVFGMSLQPEVLLGMAQTREFRGRGILGRILYVYPKSNLGSRTGNTKPVSGSERMAYSGVIKTLLSKPYATDTHGGKVPHTLKLDSAAGAAWYDFWRDIEGKLADHGELAHCRDWGGKLAGAVARIAGIFHCVRHATLHIEDYPVSSEDMASAIKVGYALIPHALKVFDSMKLDEGHDNAGIVLGWIRRNGLSEFTRRDCHKRHHSRFKKAEELDPALKILVDAGWIRERDPEKKLGRPSRIFDVNPLMKKS